ncbi:MAG: hypothetical protein MZV64_28785 [Ignavibacteriales bacterium]|nr:hypothetical protein [Ignavibacteriales bacterium]
MSQGLAVHAPAVVGSPPGSGCRRASDFADAQADGAGPGGDGILHQVDQVEAEVLNHGLPRERTWKAPARAAAISAGREADGDVENGSRPADILQDNGRRSC